MESSGTSGRHARMPVLICALVSSHIAQAHHSAAVYDTRNGTRTVSGTVEKHEWVNPHIFIMVRVPDPDAPGKFQFWRFESASPSVMSRRGVTRQSLPVGAKVTLEYWPLRRGGRSGNCERIRLEDNRVLECGGNAGPGQ